MVLFLLALIYYDFWGKITNKSIDYLSPLTITPLICCIMYIDCNTDITTKYNDILTLFVNIKLKL